MIQESLPVAVGVWARVGTVVFKLDHNLRVPYLLLIDVHNDRHTSFIRSIGCHPTPAPGELS